jgi:hypothetical protein
MPAMMSRRMLLEREEKKKAEEQKKSDEQRRTGPAKTAPRPAPVQGAAFTFGQTSVIPKLILEKEKSELGKAGQARKAENTGRPGPVLMEDLERLATQKVELDLSAIRVESIKKKLQEETQLKTKKEEMEAQEKIRKQLEELPEKGRKVLPTVFEKMRNAAYQALPESQKKAIAADKGARAEFEKSVWQNAYGLVQADVNAEKTRIVEKRMEPVMQDLKIFIQQMEEKKKRAASEKERRKIDNIIDTAKESVMNARLKEFNKIK